MCVWISTGVVCLHCYITIWLLQVKLLLSCAPFVYTMQPVFIVTSHKATYIWCMCVCMLWSGSQIINVIIMLFCCNLHFWKKDLDLWSVTAVTQGWNRYQTESQHRKLTLEKKILMPLLPGLEPVIFFYHEFGTLPLSVFTVSIFNYEYVVYVCIFSNTLCFLLHSEFVICIFSVPVTYLQPNLVCFRLLLITRSSAKKVDIYTVYMLTVTARSIKTGINVMISVRWAWYFLGGKP